MQISMWAMFIAAEEYGCKCWRSHLAETWSGLMMAQWAL